MPRGKRGGAREGEQGKAYSNRTDLNQSKQPVMVASGQPYGARQAQEAAQGAIPLPAAPPVSVPAQPRPQVPAPGSLGVFNRGTERPDEPLTAGLPIGPGSGPEVLPMSPVLSQDDQLLAQLRGLYSAFPSEDLAALIDYAERNRNSRGM